MKSKGGRLFLICSAVNVIILQLLLQNLGLRLIFNFILVTFFTHSLLFQLCNFPLFTNAGEIKIQIQVNYSRITLSDEELKKMRNFHSSLFAKILDLDKGFLAWNFSSGRNDFLIAPINEGINH